jgi:hypothetical protein
MDVIKINQTEIVCPVKNSYWSTIKRDGELTELEMVVDTRGTEGLVLDGERERDGFRERGREKFGKKAMRGLGHVFLHPTA